MQRENSMLDANKLQDQIESQVFQSEQFLHMQDKMSSYFNEKSEENSIKGKQLLNQMDSLLNDIRDLNDSMQTQNKKAKTSNTINRAVAAAGGQQNARQNNTNSTNTNNDKGIVDITEALRSYKLRSEIERAFFFHLFYEILR